MALNVEPEEDSEEEIDDTKEIQVNDEEMKRNQTSRCLLKCRLKKH